MSKKIMDMQLLMEKLQKFQPEPLIDTENLKTEKSDLEIPMITNDASDSDDTKSIIDLAKANYLNVLTNPEILETAEKTIREYGVGTCGPRAFYGTTDAHLELERKLAEFLGVEESIIYSYGFVAISSSIAAYCKRSDIVFIDREANFPIHQGLTAAKSRIVYFTQNDPNSLRIELEKVREEERKLNTKQRPSRKFLIIEAISWNSGKLCPVQDFLEIAEEFRMRVFLEESYSLGVLGENGRGITEYCNIDPSRFDMIFGTLEGAIGSIGGFCAGSNLIIEHQRLSGAGYIFSASLPTYLLKVVLRSLEILGDKPRKLMELSEKFHQFLSDDCKFVVISDPKSPFKIFKTLSNQETIVYNYCRDNDLYFIKRDNNDLMINLNVELQGERLQRAFDILLNASKLCTN